MLKVFLIPGLGADKRLFSKFELKGFDTKVVEFIPEQKDEPLEHYCRRIGDKILKEESPVIIGVSLGGIIAQEILWIKPNCKVIIVSSIRSIKELPSYLSVFRIVPIYKWIPCSLFKQFIKTLSWFFTTKNLDQKELFMEMVDAADYSFMKWAITHVIRWQMKDALSGVVQIHGDRDRLFPKRYVKNPDFIISGGQHFMIAQNADEINSIISGILGRK